MVFWPWLWFRAGRDLMRDGGWELCAVLFPRPDLRRPDEEGLLVLGGLHFEMKAGFWDRWREEPRPYLRLWWRSDAGEIATRLAAA